MKSNMAPPETGDSTAARPEYHGTYETEENDLKNNFMKMIEALIKEKKTSLKEMEEKMNKTLEEINKSLKETKKVKKKKTIKEASLVKKARVGQDEPAKPPLSPLSEKQLVRIQRNKARALLRLATRNVPAGFG
ncbi:hypothetical protein U0070_016378 [Myodes glareolus]|uniref:Uncharacterized protein n=1 Tax=Myodes glareolus TaxID=447135 RepID=A0AAW0I1I9_MYOGA